MAQKILIIAFFWGLTASEVLAQQPAAPSGLTATPVSKTQISLSWSDNSSNEDGFILQRHAGNGTWAMVEELAPNVTSYTDEGLASATTYYYQVIAKKTCVFIIPCNSGPSNEAAATTLQNPPTIDPIPDPAPINEDAGVQTIRLSGITDGEKKVNQTISIEVSSGTTSLIPTPVVSYTSPATTGTLTYQPVPNQSGTAEITVTVIDSGPENRTAKESFTVVVNAVNDPPTLNDIPSPAPITEDSGEQSISLAGITAGPGESQSLTVSAVSGNKNLIPDPVVSYDGSGATARLTYTPASDSYGTATITVTVKDSEGGTVSKTLEVSVLPVNDAPTLDPIAGPGPLSQDEGQQSIPLTGISAGINEVQNITISATSGNPALVPDPVITYTSPAESGVLTFTPAPGVSGTAEITVTVKDDGGTANGGSDTFQQKFLISVLSKPDLTIENARATMEGQSIRVSGQLVNRGKKDAAASKMAYFISVEEDFTEEAERLGESDMDALPAGSVADITESLTLPPTIPPGTYHVFFVADAGNSVDEFSEENNIVPVEIVIENMPPRITASNFPELYTIGSQGASLDITVEDNSGLEATVFHYRPVTQTAWKTVKLNGEENTFSFSLNDNIFDEIGLVYFFEVTDRMGLKTLSDTGRVYINYPGDGLNIPDIQTGSTVSDYQIVAVPLRLGNSSVLSVFEDDLGGYDQSQWRLFHFENSREIEFGQGFSDLIPGKGYWLITKENNHVDTGIGSTLPVTQANPFTLQLKEGWNLIGNPYNFDLSWKKVLEFNGNPEGVGNLRIYDGGFQDSDLLQRFTGAFVFTEAAIALQVPVVKDNPGNSGPENGRTLAAEDGSWQIHFTLSGARLKNKLGGLGMEPDAREGKDPYDAVALPPLVLIPQLEVIFKEPASPGFNLTREIVPLSPEYKWEMEIASNLDGEVTLHWNKVDLEKDLVLFDVLRQEVINMEHRNSYTFNTGASNSFQVLYGTPEYIQKSLSFSRASMGEVYPNPFSDQTAVPVFLPGKDGVYSVQLEVLDISGKSLGIISAGTYRPGRHIIPWRGRSEEGRSLSPGLYMLKLHISRNGQQQQFLEKVIIH